MAAAGPCQPVVRSLVDRQRISRPRTCAARLERNQYVAPPWTFMLRRRRALQRFASLANREGPRPAFQPRGNLRYLGPGSILGRGANSPQQATWPASQEPAEIIEPLRRGAWRSLASALDWGSRGRRFKSCRPDLHFLTSHPSRPKHQHKRRRPATQPGFARPSS